MTPARRPSAVPFPAATLYVNCTPFTFIIKSAGLNSSDEGWKAAFAQETHLPSFMEMEPGVCLLPCEHTQVGRR